MTIYKFTHCKAVAVSFIILMATSLVALSSCSAGLSSTSDADGHAAELESARLSDRSWEQVKWTGDDRPFATTRKIIDQQFASGLPPDSIVAKYAPAAVANPQNAFDQFCWAYAVHEQLLNPHAVMYDNIPLNIALARPPDPCVYDFSRLRMIMAGATAKDRKELERLLAHTPDDTEILDEYSGVLSDMNSKEDNLTAIRIGKELARRPGAKPYLIDNLSYTYAQVGFMQHSADFYEKSIAEGNLYLKITPAYDWYRADAEHRIAVLERRLTKMKREATPPSVDSKSGN
jgi:hypothetical protein